MKIGFLPAIAIALTVSFSVPSAMGQSIDLNLCEQLAVKARSGRLTPADYGSMIDECRDLLDVFMKETSRIKQLGTLQERKTAADEVNHRYAKEYEAYSAMIRIIRDALDEKVPMGRLNSVEAQHLLDDNSYVNRMFTIFRSRYEFN